ncbi:hypothetical protein AAVH_37645, partial [Aphelenchoides avenae]
ESSSNPIDEFNDCLRHKSATEPSICAATASADRREGPHESREVHKSLEGSRADEAREFEVLNAQPQRFTRTLIRQLCERAGFRHCRTETAEVAHNRVHTDFPASHFFIASDAACAAVDNDGRTRRPAKGAAELG